MQELDAAERLGARHDEEEVDLVADLTQLVLAAELAGAAVEVEGLMRLVGRGALAPERVEHAQVGVDRDRPEGRCEVGLLACAGERVVDEAARLDPVELRTALHRTPPQGQLRREPVRESAVPTPVGGPGRGSCGGVPLRHVGEGLVRLRPVPTTRPAGAFGAGDEGEPLVGARHPPQPVDADRCSRRLRVTGKDARPSGA